MRQPRDSGTRRIASWAERSLWALGLCLVTYWAWSQAAIRLEQARLEEQFFSSDTAHPDDDAHQAMAADVAVAGGALGGGTALASTTARPPVLEPGAAVALIEIPRVDVRAMVVEGIDSRSLKRAVGHIPGTAFPGFPGNVVLAAHRDTLFAGLRHIEIGDRITMKTEAGAYTYLVSAIDVVAPTAVHVMDPTVDSVLTLITCFPFDFVGPAPMRFIVSAIQENAPVPGGVPGRDGVEAPTSATSVEVRARARGASSPPSPPRPLDPELLSFLSGALVKPGAS